MRPQSNCRIGNGCGPVQDVRSASESAEGGALWNWLCRTSSEDGASKALRQARVADLLSARPELGFDRLYGTPFAKSCFMWGNCHLHQRSTETVSDPDCDSIRLSLCGRTALPACVPRRFHITIFPDSQPSSTEWWLVVLCIYHRVYRWPYGHSWCWARLVVIRFVTLK